MPPHVLSRPIIRYLFLGLYSIVLSYLINHLPFDLFSVADVAPIQEARFTASDAVNPAQLQRSHWQTKNLPDDWYESGHLVDQIWYQKQVSIEPTAETIWALYLPQVTHNAEAFINGIWVGRGGHFDAPVSRHHNEPLLFSFSSDILQQGQNRIELRVQASHPSQGLLDQFYLAPLDKLAPAYNLKHWLRLDFIRGVTTAMYILATVLFLFWLLRRKDSSYGLFSLLLFVWATHNLNLFVSEIPVSAWLWEVMTMSTLGWAVVTMVFFNHRYVGQVNRGVEKVLIAFLVLGLGIFLLPDIGLVLRLGSRFWNSALVLIGIYSIIYLLRTYHRTRDSDVYLMLLAGIPILISGFHDILVVNHLVDRREGLVIQYSVVPAVVLFSWFLVRRFIESLNQAEELTGTLEAKVEERGEKIKQQYDRLSQLEKDRTLATERERIMRDMHDGIGGQLMSLQGSLRSHADPVFKEVSTRIQACVDDLRVVINSLDPAMSDLTLLLGTMRFRFEKQLESSSIQLVWNISELDFQVDLSPEQSLHLLRIVQEAVTNSIKHSGATHLSLSVFNEESNKSAVVIKVEDNGVGLKTGHDDPLQEQSGRGLRNMHYRAEKLGARLIIGGCEQESGRKGNDKNGTSVQLTLINISSA